MSVALFFITHDGIASSLLATGESIIQKPNHNLAYSEVAMDTSIEKNTSDIENKVAQLDTSDGVIFITDIKGAKSDGQDAMATIALPMLDEFVTPLLYAIPVQLLAYHVAVIKGTDVDQPRNLAKSVTVE